MTDISVSVRESSPGSVFSCTASVTVGEEGVGASLRTFRSVGTTMTKVAHEFLGQLCLAVGGELERKPVFLLRLTNGRCTRMLLPSLRRQSSAR